VSRRAGGLFLRPGSATGAALAAASLSLRPVAAAHGAAAVDPPLQPPLPGGRGLLTITYLLVHSAASDKVNKSLLPSPAAPGSKSQPHPNPLGVSCAVSCAEQFARAQARAILGTHAIDMHELLTSSGIALAVMAVVTVALGWPVAGRILRPLRTMTTATQRITELNLHERLVLPGPSDEVKDLPAPGPSALFQVRNSSGAWNQWPDGQRIFTHSIGPLVERMVNQSLTSAGRPHC